AAVAGGEVAPPGPQGAQLLDGQPGRVPAVGAAGDAVEPLGRRGGEQDRRAGPGGVLVVARVPGPADDVEGVVEAAPELGVVDADRGELGGRGVEAEADREAAVGEDVQRGERPGE